MFKTWIDGYYNYIIIPSLPGKGKELKVKPVQLVIIGSLITHISNTWLEINVELRKMNLSYFFLPNATWESTYLLICRL